MSDTKKRGVGIIGCGTISASHARAYKELAGLCEIRAVSDLDVARAKQFAASIHPDVAVYEDYRRLLLRDDIDIVSVCTPPFVHKEITVEACRMGKHVLCEKPLAPSLADCDEMIAAAKRHSRKLGVVFQYRYRQDFKQLKHIVDEGLLGPVALAQMNGLYWRGDLYYKVPWRGKWSTECGGVTMNQAIHPLDIFQSLLGEAATVYAEMGTLAHDIQVEDTLTASIRFRSGAIGQIACTTNAARPDISMGLHGKYASVTMPKLGDPLQFAAKKDSARGGEPDTGLAERMIAAASQVTGYPVHSHTGSILDLLDSVAGDTEPMVDGREGRKSVELVTALYKSGSTGDKVSLPISQDDPWYTTEGILAHVKHGGGRSEENRGELS